MKRRVIRIPQNLYDDIIYLAERKSLSKKEALSYSIRLAKSVLESEKQLEREITSLFTTLRGIPADSKREIAYQIRNMSRLNRGLKIMIEILQEDLGELRNNSMFIPNKKR